MSDRYDDEDDDSSQIVFETDDEMTNGPTPLERAMEDHSEGDVESSQLPAIEEYKSQVAASRARANKVLARESHNPRSIYTESKKKRKDFMILGGIIVVVFILSISIGVSVGRKKATKGSEYAANDPFGDDFGSDVPPTGRPTHMFDSQTLEVVDFVTSMGWSDAFESRNQDSPQYRAANWLADFDPLQLEVAATLDFRQRYALAVFFYALDGDGGSWQYRDLLFWLSEKDVCDWRTPMKTVVVGNFVQIGVKCRGTKEVKEIVLPNAGLRGPIPSELSLLSGLENLVLWENDLTGNLPESFQKLTLLQEIDLHNNFLEGALPEWLGDLSQLTSLNLAFNGITGELPDLSGLSILSTINIGYNLIQDDVAKLSPLRNVQNMIAANNSFYGHFTADILESWDLVEIMDLSDNRIDGTLPGILFYMSHLEVIDLSGNSIDGSLPDAVRLDSRMALLALHNNKLQGNFDIITTHMPNLAHLDLSHNNFIGTIPEDWSGMTDLRYLFLADNDFAAGLIPASLTELSTLEDLSLQATRREGVVPSGFGSVSSLKLLDLSFNNLTGEIPLDIGDATNLQFLFLNQNNMTGEVPGSLVNLDQLRSLLLDHNELSSMSAMICDKAYSQLDYFIADCDEIGCSSSCCTECCVDVVPGDVDALGNRVNDTCNADPWLGVMDPISEYEYRRGVYQFHDNDIRFPTLEPAPSAIELTASPTEAPAPTATERPTRADISPVSR